VSTRLYSHATRAVGAPIASLAQRLRKPRADWQRRAVLGRDLERGGRAAAPSSPTSRRTRRDLPLSATGGSCPTTAERPRRGRSARTRLTSGVRRRSCSPPRPNQHRPTRKPSAAGCHRRQEFSTRPKSPNPYPQAVLSEPTFLQQQPTTHRARRSRLPGDQLPRTRRTPEEICQPRRRSR